MIQFADRGATQDDRADAVKTIHHTIEILDRYPRST